MAASKRIRRTYETKVTQCKCEHCGKKFELPTSVVARGKGGKFCSRSCVNFARDYKPIPPEIRFWAKVEKTPTCWLWRGYVRPDGYGDFGQSTIPGDNEYAHRYSYRLAHGAIPDGLLVLHHFDVRNCVNPKHLYAGTAKQNTGDMFARNRAKPPRGESHFCAKLKAADVRRAREMRRNGMYWREIAEAFSVNEATTRRAVTGKSWSWVT